MVKIYEFSEHDVSVKGERDDLIELAENLRKSKIEGTWSDLVYQIEYAFDIDGIRTANGEEFDENYEDNYLSYQYK
jgi:hypothetical protein